jgi:hypothetical protein
MTNDQKVIASDRFELVIGHWSLVIGHCNFPLGALVAFRSAPRSFKVLGKSYTPRVYMLAWVFVA